jgi:rod shape-determining protein MreC
MQIISFFFERHLDKTVLAVAVILSIFLLTRPDDSTVAAGRVISSYLFYPVERVKRYVGSLDELREENRRLRRLVASLNHEKEMLLQYREERNRLRELLGFRRDGFWEFLPCEVIARSASSYHNSITLDRGGDDGVRAGMPVVGYRGLVGRVTQVFPSSARAILLNNTSVQVSCLDKRSRVVGVLGWERGNLFRLDYVGREEDIQPGDTLVTSGLGRVFPKGFPVGTVFQVTADKTELSRRVGVVSMTDLNRLEEVFIITGSREWESGEVWRELQELQQGGGPADEGRKGDGE